MGHTHDPNEVTVQIDGVGRRLQPAYEGREPDGPVFVDESGSRGRRLRRIGWLLGIACAVYAVVLGVSLLSGTSDAPWMPGLGKERDDRPAGRVEPSPSSTAVDSGRAAPDASGTPGPTGSDRARPVPAAGVEPDAPREQDDPSATTGSPGPGKDTGEPRPGKGLPTPDPTEPDPTEPEPDPGPGNPTTPPVDPPESPAAGPTGAATR